MPFALTQVRAHPVPTGSLLARYTQTGAYTDCFATDVPGNVVQAHFVEAFYTGRVFKLERLLLKWFVLRPSSDPGARQLARGEVETFAAWHVEARAPDQLLLCDLANRTRSWLSVEPTDTGTRLFFGSAVVPVLNRSTGERRMGLAFRLLLGFHKLYSRVLLAEARARLQPS